MRWDFDWFGSVHHGTMEERRWKFYTWRNNENFTALLRTAQRCEPEFTTDFTDLASRGEHAFLKLRGLRLASGGRRLPPLARRECPRRGP